MASSVQWARPLDERTVQHATDYATRSARFAIRRGEASIAVRMARQLIMAQPGEQAHRDLLADALAARDAASDFIARNSGASDPQALNSLAASHLALGDTIAASQMWLALARANPTDTDPFVSFAWCMARAGNTEIASQIAGRLGETTHPKVAALRMILALAAGKDEEALAEAILAQKLVDAFVWLPHGAVFASTGVVNAASLRLGDRLEDLAAVMHLYPVGQALQDGRNDDAIAGADKVLALVPDDHWAAMFKVMALIAKDDKAGAAQAQAALAASSGVRLDMLDRLIALLSDLSAHRLVIDFGQLVVERLANNAVLLSTIGHSAAHLAEMELFDEMKAALEPLAERVSRSGMSPFVVMSLTDDPVVHKAAAVRRAEKMAGPERPAAMPLCKPPAAGESLRVGYFSNDFHNHATMKLLVEVLEATDRSRFTTFAYSYDQNPDNTERDRVRAAIDGFHEVAHLSDEDIAEKVRQDGVHVLVDLKGFTRGSRFAAMKHRMAPIQVNWLGYPGTYGLPEADYIIADPFIIPEGADGDYTEAVVRLPDCYQPNRRSRDVVETPSREMVGLPETGFVFASFNQVYKVNAPVFAAWMDVLEAVPGSVLWLLVKEDEVGERLKARAEAAGVDPARIVIAPSLPHDMHLARYGLVDLALDTFPVGSHTTASDAIWMGAPLLALAGRSFISRVSGSIVTAAGLPHLVAHSLDEYVAKAIALGNDPGTAAAMREDLLRRRDTMPLFDPARFAEHLGRAYEGMVEIWRRGEKPHAFDVPSVDMEPQRSVEVA